MADYTDNNGSYNTGGYFPDGTNSTNYNNSVSGNTNYGLNDSANRLSLSGLIAGGLNSLLSGTNINFLNSYGSIAPENDWRVRVSISPSLPILYNDYNNVLLNPLTQTSGVVFPYTPNIQVQHTARYGSSQLTHSNYNSYFYEGSEVSAINITADFTVQNIAEGQYLLAVIYFFRAITKMFFGKDTYGLAGTPPPMVFLDGYGSHYLPHVPCVATQFTHTMPQDVDYVEIPVYQNVSTGMQGIFQNIFGTGDAACPTRMPTQSQVQLTLQPVYSRRNVSQNFDMASFANGTLLGAGSTGPGGFI